MGTVSGHQLSTFSSPVNGTSPIDANTVRGNDNTIKTSYNAHDADTTIHLQNGLVASRPSASTAGQTWLATDTGAVYLWLDTGSAWVEANYLRNTGGTVSGQVVVVSTTGPQLTVEYDGTHTYTVSVDASGNATLNATGSLTVTPATTHSGLVTLANGATVSSGKTLTLTGATVAGTPTWSSSQAITLSTAAQPNITSVGTLTSLTVSGSVSVAGVSTLAASSSDLQITANGGVILRVNNNIAAATALTLASDKTATFAGAISAAALPTSAGASGTLYVDASGFVKRA